MKKFLSISLALTMLLSTFAMAAGPSAFVPTESAEEITEVSAVQEYEEKAPTDDLAFLEDAILIYSDDFQSYSPDTEIPRNLTVSPAFVAEGYNVKYNSDAGPTLTVKQEANGNKYLNIGKKGTWDMLAVYFPNDLSAPGKYYFVTSYNMTYDMSSWLKDVSMTSYTNGKGGDGHPNKSYSVINGNGWTTQVYTLDVVARSEAEAAGVTFTNNAGDKFLPAAWIDKMYVYSTSVSAANAGDLRIDNLACYFVPASETIETVTVTFDKNLADDGAVVPEPAVLDRMTSLDYASYTATSTLDDCTFLGWSLAPDGGVLKGTYNLTGDVTLYAKWKSNIKYTLPGLGWEMDAKPSQFANFGANSGKVNSEYGYADGDAAALRLTQNEPGTKSKKSLTSIDPVTLEPVTQELYSVYDFNANVTVNALAAAIKNIAIRYKFVTPYDERKSGANTQLFFITDTLGISEGRSFKPVFVADGEYHIININPATSSAWNGIIKSFRFDPLNDLFAGEELYIDYIRLENDYPIPTEETAVTFTPANGSTSADYRDNTIKVTFPEAPDATLAQVAAAFGTSYAGLSYDSDTYTYTIMNTSQTSLFGKTVSVSNAYIYGNNKNYKLPSYSFTYSSAMAKDGENLMPNGDFSLNWNNCFASNGISITNGIMTSSDKRATNIYNTTSP